MHPYKPPAITVQQIIKSSLKLVWNRRNSKQTNSKHAYRIFDYVGMLIKSFITC